MAGETGSGKTTQIPKICLELGRGIRGQIGHTQPRRIAARTVAERIAEELGTPLGSTVGYKVRFTDQVTDETMVKVMTDGILLAEIQNDRMLWRYDTLIIDEAHERSLNIDFILGYLRDLLPRRPDLKLIITSATIETQRFAEHFAGPKGPAPVIEVSGRTYPVEVRYRPLVDADRGGRAAGGADRPGRRHRRGGRRAGRREQRRHPGVPQRRAGDPRHRRRPEQEGTAQHRDRPAVRAALRGRAAQGVPAPHRPPGGARHQRRRDLADRARHPLRDRPRHRPHLPLQQPAQGAAAARSSRSRRPAPTSARAAAAAPRTASASGCTPRRTSRPARRSPSRRSCAPTWPRSSCR